MTVVFDLGRATKRDQYFFSFFYTIECAFLFFFLLSFFAIASAYGVGPSETNTLWWVNILEVSVTFL